jgi:hypothetical protein
MKQQTKAGPPGARIFGLVCARWPVHFCRSTRAREKQAFFSNIFFQALTLQLNRHSPAALIPQPFLTISLALVYRSLKIQVSICSFGGRNNLNALKNDARKAPVLCRLHHYCTRRYPSTSKWHYFTTGTTNQQGKDQRGCLWTPILDASTW